MKNKNTYRALLLVAGLSLANLKGQPVLAKDNSVASELETEEDRKEIREKWKNFASEMSQNESMNVDYSGDYNLCLYNKYHYEGKKELSEEFYENLNTLLENNAITRIYFKNVDNRFDFSKVNLSHVENLALELVEYEETLPESIFAQKFSELYFYDVSTDVAKELLLNCSTKDTVVYWQEHIENQGNLKILLEFLTKERIEMGTFHVWQINEQNYSGITEEEVKLLGKVQSSSISVDVDGLEQPFNMNIALNEKIENFRIALYKNFYDDVNGELGNVKITSSNENLTCVFSHVDVTKNTHFSIPNSISVELKRLNIKDIAAICSLKNVQNLFLGSYYIPGMAPEYLGHVEYKKDGDFFSDPVAHVIGQYTDFQQMLSYLDSCIQLLKVRENLEVSTHRYSYYGTTLEIGDIVNLNSENAVVFENGKDLQNQENGLPSYYGTTELRCISSFYLVKGEETVEVYNMEDYKYYIDEGFVVTGYDLVNQYSLNSDGTIIPEGCYDEKSIHSEFVPFR